MPKVNKFGNWCSGKGGGIIYYGDGTPNHKEEAIPYQAGDARWLNGFTIVGQHCSDICVVKSWDKHSKELTVISESGASHLEANAGVWAKWLGGNDPNTRGLTISTGVRLPDSDLGNSVGPDGAVAFKISYLSAGPWDVIEVDNTRWRLYDGDLGDLTLLGNRRAVFSNQFGKIIGVGVEAPVTVTKIFYFLHAYFLDSELWIVYQDENGRLVTHPAYSTFGHILDVGDTFYPDAIQTNDGSVIVAWAKIANDDDVRLYKFDANTPRVNLVSEVIDSEDIMIPAFEKPIWQAPFFSHSRQYGITPLDKHVGNAIWLRTSEKELNPGVLPLITQVDTSPNDIDVNLTIAYWISGGSPAELNNKISEALSYPEKPIIAYLDGDGWPVSNPFGSDRIWPSIMTYRFPNESLAAFESKMTTIIGRVNSYGLPMVMTSRFDDFNGDGSIAATLECMPLYDKWLREFNFVGHMPFSDRRGNAISSNQSLWNWARAFQYAIPAGRPNRFDYWRPAGMSEKQVLDNKLHQSRPAVVLEKYLRDYILNFDEGGEPLEWPDLLPIVKQVRAKYPDLVNVDQCVAIVNEVSKLAPAKYEFGLLVKNGGNHGTLPDGTKCSVDWCVSKALGLGTDCLISTPSSTEGPALSTASPNWGSQGEEFDISKWKEPI
jgi:hypothetical protein